MNKVTIEITAKGWQTKVEIDGKTATEKHNKSRFGSTSEGELFENNDLIDDELLTALESAKSGAYDIMTELDNYVE